MSIIKLAHVEFTTEIKGPGSPKDYYYTYGRGFDAEGSKTKKGIDIALDTDAHAVSLTLPEAVVRRTVIVPWNLVQHAVPMAVEAKAKAKKAA